MGNSEDLESGSTPTQIKEWNGPDDPVGRYRPKIHHSSDTYSQDNPYNWSSKKKFYHMAVPTAIAFLWSINQSAVQDQIHD